VGDEVSENIQAAPEGRRAALERLRDMCREHLPGFAEDMRYGMPSYSRDGEVEVSFADQKRHIALYVLRTDVMAAHSDALKGLDTGKGVIRYTSPRRIDWDVVRSLL
jgi:uncharacterized protein YdhG (YjbR/CyaY superfamily)